MKNLHDVWQQRFVRYINEVQKYMRYVFTGHLAIVLVFVIGAGGYQYSEWLKVAPKDFPAVWVVAAVLGIMLSFSRPVTLIHKADEVYLLPLESKLEIYFKKALKWTVWSQLLYVVVPFIVAIPLLRSVGDVSLQTIILTFVLVILLKWWNVQVEFSFRWANQGKGVFGDRFIRALISVVVVAGSLFMNVFMMLIVAFTLLYYALTWHRQRRKLPFPYEHFIRTEQNRMLSFYRFANNFTDVPHISGSIHRRAWLDWLGGLTPYAKKNAQSYLVLRTFIRTDDHFYLWIRLTVLAALGAAFINIPAVVWVFVGALAFATALQLKDALLGSDEFRMDMLYPLHENSRSLAVRKTVRGIVFAQAIIVYVSSMTVEQSYIVPIVMVVIGELTLRFSKG